jgi:UDP-N-acetylglucosamine 2-epimerase (non-hydrolysing)
MRNKKKILIVIGTRPEAIKIAPLYSEIKRSKKFFLKLCISGQHKEMIDQALEAFDMNIDYFASSAKKNLNLNELSSELFKGLDRIYSDFRPDLVLVHGDTTTTQVASMAAFLKDIKVGHIEAGLRSNDKNSPFPEEINRRVASLVTDYHFAPTENAKQNLILENIPKKNIFVTGNTIIDSLKNTLQKIESNKSIFKKLDKNLLKIIEKNADRKIILITGHRRENFGRSFENICLAIKDLADEFEENVFIYPVHLNPNVRKPVMQLLKNKKNIFLIDPLDYINFLYLMKKCSLVITDSGGLQEECPSLGLPLVLMRNKTERPEIFEYEGFSMTGPDRKKIIYASRKYLTLGEKIKKKNLFGDGNASKRIVKTLLKEFS